MKPRGKHSLRVLLLFTLLARCWPNQIKGGSSDPTHTMAEPAENVNVSISKQSLVDMIERMKNVTVLLLPHDQLENEQNARSATGDDLLMTSGYGATRGPVV